MSIGTHILAWRQHRRLKQEEVALKTGLARPYVSRLEKGAVDPTLSSLHRLAGALDITVGQLVDQLPPAASMTRHELDELARAAIEPGTKNALRLPKARVLARLIKERRRALGLYVPRHAKPNLRLHPEGLHAARWLRASLGENQWKALLSRIDKLASLHAEEHESA